MRIVSVTYVRSANRRSTERSKRLFLAGLRAWDRAPYSWNMVNLFLFGCHVTERTYASTDCTGRVRETIKRKGGVSQASRPRH